MPNIKFKQIAIGQYGNQSGSTYTVIGLSEDGYVYRHRVNAGWEPLVWSPTGKSNKKRLSPEQLDLERERADDADVPF